MRSTSASPIKRRRLSSRARTTVVDHVELVQGRRHGRAVESSSDAGPMPVDIVVADQRCRVLVADIDRLWVFSLPKIGQRTEIQARPMLVVVADQLGQRGLGTVFGSCNPRTDIARLARLYQSGQLQLDEMITKRYRLDDINDAYADLLNGEIIRGVIDFASVS